MTGLVWCSDGAFDDSIRLGGNDPSPQDIANMNAASSTYRATLVIVAAVFASLLIGQRVLSNPAEAKLLQN